MEEGDWWFYEKDLYFNRLFLNCFLGLVNTCYEKKLSAVNNSWERDDRINIWLKAYYSVSLITVSKSYC